MDKPLNSFTRNSYTGTTWLSSTINSKHTATVVASITVVHAPELGYFFPRVWPKYYGPGQLRIVVFFDDFVDEIHAEFLSYHLTSAVEPSCIPIDCNTFSQVRFRFLYVSSRHKFVVHKVAPRRPRRIQKDPALPWNIVKETKDKIVN